MIIKFLSLGLTCMIAFQLSAQQKDSTYAPIGAKWYYVFRGYRQHSGWIDECVRDTMVGAHRFAIVKRTLMDSNFPIPRGEVFRGIRNDSLIEFSKSDTSFLGYFGWTANDTISIEVNNSLEKRWDTVSISFQLTDTILNSSDTLLKILPHITPTQRPGFGYRYRALVQGIGSMSHKIFFDGSALDGFTAPELLCYEEPTGFKWSKNQNASCLDQFREWIVLDVEEFTKSSKYNLVYDNEKLKVISQFENIGSILGVKLYAFNGNIVRHVEPYELHTSIDISTLPKGNYIVTISQDNGQIQVLKFFK